MSRSRKKTPIIKDKNKGMKNHANRKVRRRKDAPQDGSSYKKIFPQYDICDYSFRTPLKEVEELVISEAKSYLNGATNVRSRAFYSPYLKEDIPQDIEELTVDELLEYIDIRAWRGSYHNK